MDFGNHHDGIVEYSLVLRRDIAREIRRRKPDFVITGDYGNRFVQGMLNQADHRAASLNSLTRASSRGASGCSRSRGQ